MRGFLVAMASVDASLASLCTACLESEDLDWALSARLAACCLLCFCRMSFRISMRSLDLLVRLTTRALPVGVLSSIICGRQRSQRSSSMHC